MGQPPPCRRESVGGTTPADHHRPRGKTPSRTQGSDPRVVWGLHPLKNPRWWPAILEKGKKRIPHLRQKKFFPSLPYDLENSAAVGQAAAEDGGKEEARYTLPKNTTFFFPPVPRCLPNQMSPPGKYATSAEVLRSSLLAEGRCYPGCRSQGATFRGCFSLISSEPVRVGATLGS